MTNHAERLKVIKQLHEISNKTIKKRERRTLQDRRKLLMSEEVNQLFSDSCPDSLRLNLLSKVRRETHLQLSCSDTPTVLLGEVML